MLGLMLNESFSPLTFFCIDYASYYLLTRGNVAYNCWTGQMLMYVMYNKIEYNGKSWKA